MYFSDQRDSNPSAKNQNHVCPKCGFDNHAAAIYCEICFYPLNVTTYPPEKNPPPKSKASQRGTKPKNNLKQELKKTSVISGLSTLCLFEIYQTPK